MAACDVCKKPGIPRGKLHRRLAIPEYRAMIGFWTWVDLRVCDACLEAHDRDFRERLALLAPDVMENDEPVVGEVCLACGTVEPRGAWRVASRWVDAAGRPVRRCRFTLCGDHAALPYVDGIIVSSNLADARSLAAVLDELPTAGADLLGRVEGWRPPEGRGPQGATDFTAGRTRDETLAQALAFWQASPEGLEAKAAWMGPIRKDYRMRYRLDLVRDLAGGCRETLTVVRTDPERFTTYRAAAVAPK